MTQVPRKNTNDFLVELYVINKKHDLAMDSVAKYLENERIRPMQLPQGNPQPRLKVESLPLFFSEQKRLPPFQSRAYPKFQNI